METPRILGFAGRLESAGLVVRERRGQCVFVHRTMRGAALLALYRDQVRNRGPG